MPYKLSRGEKRKRPQQRNKPRKKPTAPRRRKRAGPRVMQGGGRPPYIGDGDGTIDVRRVSQHIVNAQPIRVGGGAQGFSKQQKAADANAMMYVGCLSDPTSGQFDGARVPDFLAVGTATSTLVEDFAVVTNTSQSQQYVISAQFSATGAAALNSRTATAGVYPAFASPVASTNLALATSNFGTYRTVGFGAKLIPQTQLQNRGGTIRAARVTNMLQLSTSPLALSANPNVVEYSGASTDIEEAVFNWLPEDYDSAAEFVAPAADATPGALVFEFPAVAVAQNYILRTWHAVEFVPFPGTEQIFAVASTPGDEGAFSKAYRWAQAAAGVADRVLPGTSVAMGNAASTFLRSALGAGVRFVQERIAGGAAAFAGGGMLSLSKRIKSYQIRDGPVVDAWHPHPQITIVEESDDGELVSPRSHAGSCLRLDKSGSYGHVTRPATKRD